MTKKKTTINKLFHAYDRAEAALTIARDQEFPPGTKVRSRIDPDHVTEVTTGSLYAHQVNTVYGHMSWRWLEKV